MDELVFTPASLIDILSQIDELKDLNVGISQTPDGETQLQVGSSIYMLEPENEKEIYVDRAVVEDVEDANFSAYENLGSEFDVTDNLQAVESGIIKELAKTLLIGGMVRLAAKTLKN